MALRISDRLIDGYLDNAEPGKVTGQLRFVGLDKPVMLNLRGDFHRDIRGAVIMLKGNEAYRGGPRGPVESARPPPVRRGGGHTSAGTTSRAGVLQT